MNASKGVNVTRQDLRNLRRNHEEHDEEIICHRCHKKTKEVRTPSQNTSSQSQEHKGHQYVNRYNEGPSYMEIVIGDVKAVPKRKYQKIYVRGSDEIGRHDEKNDYRTETETRQVQYDASEWKELKFNEEPKRLMVDASVGSTHGYLHKTHVTKGYQTTYKGHIRHNKKNRNKCIGLRAESRKQLQVHQKLSPILNICPGTTSPISITASIESNQAIEVKGQATSTRVKQVVYNSTFTLKRNRSDTEESKPTLESEAVDDSASMIVHRGHEESFTIHKSFSQEKEESSDKLVKDIYKKLDFNLSDETKETYLIGGKISSRKFLKTKLKEKRKETKTHVSSVVSKESKLTNKSTRGSKLFLSLRRRFEALRRRLGIKEELFNNNELSPIIKCSSHYCPSFKDVSISSDPPSLIARPYMYSRQDISCNNARVGFKFWRKKKFDEEPKRDICRGNVKAKRSQTKQGKKSKMKNDKREISASNENTAKLSGIMAKNNITACRCDVKSIMKMKGSDNLNTTVTATPNANSKIAEKYLDSWLDKFILNNSDSSGNEVIVRWDSINCQRRSSSSTIFELMDYLYKDIGLDLRSSDVSRKLSQKQHNPYHQILPTFVIHSCEYKPPLVKETPLTRKNSEDRNKSKKKQLRVTKNKWIYERKPKKSLKTQIVLHAMYTKGRDLEYCRIDISSGLLSGSITDRSNSKKSDERVFQVVNYDTPGSSKIAESFVKATDYEDFERQDCSSFELPDCSTVLKIIDWKSTNHVEPETSVLEEAKTESIKNSKLIDSVEDYGYYQECASQSYANAWQTDRNNTKSRLDVNSKSCPNFLESCHAYIDKFIDNICDNTTYLKQSRNTVLTKRLKKIWQRLQRKTTMSDSIIGCGLKSWTSCSAIGDWENETSQISAKGTSSKPGILNSTINKECNEISVSISTTGGDYAQKADHSQRIQSLHQVDIDKRGDNLGKIRKEKATREVNSPQRPKRTSDDAVQKMLYTTLASTDSLSIVIQDSHLIKLLLSSFIEPSKKKPLTVSHSAQRSNFRYESISTQYSMHTKTQSQPKSTQEPSEKTFRIPKETQISASVCSQRSQSAPHQQIPPALGLRITASWFNSKSERSRPKVSQDIHKSLSKSLAKVLQCPEYKSKETIRQSLCKIKGHFEEHPFCTLKSMLGITPCPSKSIKKKSDKKDVMCACAEKRIVRTEEICDNPDINGVIPNCNTNSIINKSQNVDSVDHPSRTKESSQNAMKSYNAKPKSKAPKTHSEQKREMKIVKKGSKCTCPEPCDRPFKGDDKSKVNENFKESSEDYLRHDPFMNSGNSARFQKSHSKQKRQKKIVKKGSRYACPELSDHPLKEYDICKDNKNSKESSDDSVKHDPSTNSENSPRCACSHIIVIGGTPPDDDLTPSKDSIDSPSPKSPEESSYISLKHYPSLVFLPCNASHSLVPSNKSNISSKDCKPKDTSISCLCTEARPKVRNPDINRDKCTPKISRASAGKDKQYSVSRSLILPNESRIKTPNVLIYPRTADPSIGHFNKKCLPESNCFSTEHTSFKPVMGRECEGAKHLTTDQNEQVAENEKSTTSPEVVLKQSVHIKVEKRKKKHKPSKIPTLNRRPYVPSGLSESSKRESTTSCTVSKTFTPTKEKKNPNTIKPSAQRRPNKADIQRKDDVKLDCHKRQPEPPKSVNNVGYFSDALTLKPKTTMSEAPKLSFVNTFQRITKASSKPSPKHEGTKLHEKHCTCLVTVPDMENLTDLSNAVDQTCLATDCKQELIELAPSDLHENLLHFAPNSRFGFNPGVTDYGRTTTPTEQKCLSCFSNTRKVVITPSVNSKTIDSSEAAKSINKPSESAKFTRNTNSTKDCLKSMESKSVVSDAQETSSYNKELPSSPSSPSCSCKNKNESSSKARSEETAQSFQEQYYTNKSDSTKKSDSSNDSSKYASNSGMTTENIEQQRSSIQTRNYSSSKSRPEETSQSILEKSTQEKSCIEKLKFKLFPSKRKKLDCDNVISKDASCDKLTTQNAHEQCVSNNTSKETSQGSEQNSSSKKSDISNAISRDVSCYSRVVTENAEQQCSTIKTSNKYTSKSRSEVTSESSPQKSCKKRSGKSAFSSFSLKDANCESRITTRNAQEQFPSHSNWKDTSKTTRGISSSKNTESSKDTSTTKGYAKRTETLNAGLQCSRHTDTSTQSRTEDYRGFQQKSCNKKSDNSHDISNVGRLRNIATQNTTLQRSRHTSASGLRSRSEEILRSTKQSCRENVDYNIKALMDISGESRTTILRWISYICPKIIKDSIKPQREIQKTEADCGGCYDHTCKNYLCTGCSDSITVTNQESSLNDEKSTPCSSKHILYGFSSKNQSEQMTHSTKEQSCSKKSDNPKNTSYYRSLKTQADQQCLPCFDDTCMNDYCPSRIMKNVTAISTKQPCDTNKLDNLDDTSNSARGENANFSQNPKNEVCAIKKAIFDDITDLVYENPKDISNKESKKVKRDKPVSDTGESLDKKMSQDSETCSSKEQSKEVATKKVKENEQKESSKDSGRCSVKYTEEKPKSDGNKKEKTKKDQKECPYLQESIKKKDKAPQESSEDSSENEQTTGRCLSKKSKELPEEVSSKKDNTKNKGQNITDDSGSFSSETKTNVDPTLNIKKKKERNDKFAVSGAGSCPDKGKEMNKNKEEKDPRLAEERARKKNKRDREKSSSGSCPCSVKGKKKEQKDRDADMGSCFEKERTKKKTVKDQNSGSDERCASYKKEEKAKKKKNKKGQNRESVSCSSSEETKKNNKKEQDADSCTSSVKRVKKSMSKSEQDLESSSSSCSLREKSSDKKMNQEAKTCSSKDSIEQSKEFTTKKFKNNEQQERSKDSGRCSVKFREEKSMAVGGKKKKTKIDQKECPYLKESKKKKYKELQESAGDSSENKQTSGRYSSKESKELPEQVAPKKEKNKNKGRKSTEDSKEHSKEITTKKVNENEQQESSEDSGRSSVKYTEEKSKADGKNKETKKDQNECPYLQASKKKKDKELQERSEDSSENKQIPYLSRESKELPEEVAPKKEKTKNKGQKSTEGSKELSKEVATKKVKENEQQESSEDSESPSVKYSEEKSKADGKKKDQTKKDQNECPYLQESKKKKNKEPQESSEDSSENKQISGRYSSKESKELPGEVAPKKEKTKNKEQKSTEDSKEQSKEAATKKVKENKQQESSEDSESPSVKYSEEKSKADGKKKDQMTKDQKESSYLQESKKKKNKELQESSEDSSENNKTSGRYSSKEGKEIPEEVASKKEKTKNKGQTSTEESKEQSKEVTTKKVKENEQQESSEDTGRSSVKYTEEKSKAYGKKNEQTKKDQNECPYLQESNKKKDMELQESSKDSSENKRTSGRYSSKESKELQEEVAPKKEKTKNKEQKSTEGSTEQSKEAATKKNKENKQQESSEDSESPSVKYSEEKSKEDGKKKDQTKKDQKESPYLQESKKKKNKEPQESSEDSSENKQTSGRYSSKESRELPGEVAPKKEKTKNKEQTSTENSKEQSKEAATKKVKENKQQESSEDSECPSVKYSEEKSKADGKKKYQTTKDQKESSYLQESKKKKNKELQESSEDSSENNKTSGRYSSKEGKEIPEEVASKKEKTKNKGQTSTEESKEQSKEVTTKKVKENEQQESSEDTGRSSVKYTDEKSKADRKKTEPTKKDENECPYVQESKKKKDKELQESSRDSSEYKQTSARYSSKENKELPEEVAPKKEKTKNKGQKSTEDSKEQSREVTTKKKKENEQQESSEDSESLSVKYSEEKSKADGKKKDQTKKDQNECPYLQESNKKKDKELQESSKDSSENKRTSGRYSSKESKELPEEVAPKKEKTKNKEQKSTEGSKEQSKEAATKKVKENKQQESSEDSESPSVKYSEEKSKVDGKKKDQTKKDQKESPYLQESKKKKDKELQESSEDSSENKQTELPEEVASKKEKTKNKGQKNTEDSKEQSKEVTIKKVKESEQQESSEDSESPSVKYSEVKSKADGKKKDQTKKDQKESPYLQESKKKKDKELQESSEDSSENKQTELPEEVASKTEKTKNNGQKNTEDRKEQSKEVTTKKVKENEQQESSQDSESPSVKYSEEKSKADGKKKEQTKKDQNECPYLQESKKKKDREQQESSEDNSETKQTAGRYSLKESKEPPEEVAAKKEKTKNKGQKSTEDSKEQSKEAATKKVKENKQQESSEDSESPSVKYSEEKSKAGGKKKDQTKTDQKESPYLQESKKKKDKELHESSEDSSENKQTELPEEVASKKEKTKNKGQKNTEDSKEQSKEVTIKKVKESEQQESSEDSESPSVKYSEEKSKADGKKKEQTKKDQNECPYLQESKKKKDKELQESSEDSSENKQTAGRYSSKESKELPEEIAAKKEKTKNKGQKSTEDSKEQSKEAATKKVKENKQQESSEESESPSVKYSDKKSKADGKNKDQTKKDQNECPYLQESKKKKDKELQESSEDSSENKQTAGRYSLKESKELPEEVAAKKEKTKNKGQKSTEESKEQSKEAATKKVKENKQQESSEDSESPSVKYSEEKSKAGGKKKDQTKTDQKESPYLQESKKKKDKELQESSEDSSENKQTELPEEVASKKEKSKNKGQKNTEDSKEQSKEVTIKKVKESEQQESSEDSESPSVKYSEEKSKADGKKKEQTKKDQNECPYLQESKKKKDKELQESSEDSSENKQTAGRYSSKESKELPEEVAPKKEKTKNKGQKSTEDSKEQSKEAATKKVKENKQQESSEDSESPSVKYSEEKSKADGKKKDQTKKDQKESPYLQESKKKKDKELQESSEDSSENKQTELPEEVASKTERTKNKGQKNTEDRKEQSKEVTTKKVKENEQQESSQDSGRSSVKYTEEKSKADGKKKEQTKKDQNECPYLQESKLKKDKVLQEVAPKKEKTNNKGQYNTEDSKEQLKEVATKKDKGNRRRKRPKDSDDESAESGACSCLVKQRARKEKKDRGAEMGSCSEKEGTKMKNQKNNKKRETSCDEGCAVLKNEKRAKNKNNKIEMDGSPTESKEENSKYKNKKGIKKKKGRSSKGSCETAKTAEENLKSSSQSEQKSNPKNKKIKEVHCECSEALLEEKKKMKKAKSRSKNDLEQCSYVNSKLVNCGCQTVSEGTSKSGNKTNKQELACGDLNPTNKPKIQPTKINFNETVEDNKEKSGEKGENNQSAYSVTRNKNNFKVRDDEGRVVVERRNYKANEEVEESDGDDKSDEIIEIRFTLKIDQCDKTKDLTIDNADKNYKAIEMHPQTSKHDLYYFHDKDKISPQNKTKPSDVTVRITVRNISHEGNQTPDVENMSADHQHIVPTIFDVKEADGRPSFIPIKSRTKQNSILSATISEFKSSSSENCAITLVGKCPKGGITDQPFVYDDLYDLKMKGSTSAPSVSKKRDKYISRRIIEDKTKKLYDKNDLQNKERLKRNDNYQSIFLISSAEDASNESMKVKFVGIEPKEVKNTDSKNNYYIRSTTTSETAPSSFQLDTNKELPEWCNDISYRNESWNRLKKCVCASFARRFNSQEIESPLRDEKRCYCKQQQVVEEITSCNLTGDNLTSESDEEPFVNNSLCNRITVSKAVTKKTGAYLKIKKNKRTRMKDKSNEKCAFEFKSKTVLFERTYYQELNNLGVFKGSKTKKVKKKHKSDVLQSYAMKKAVLEIYREKKRTKDEDNKDED